jgi:hypothetical protein
MNKHQQPKRRRPELPIYLLAPFAIMILLGHSNGVFAQSQWTTNGNNINNTNTGSVGIGTADPTSGGLVGAKVTIVTPDDTSTALATGNGALPRFALNNHANGSWTMYDFVGNAWHSGITQLSGNVGIGTTSPSTTLDVAGSGKFQGPSVNTVVKNTTGWTQSIVVRSIGQAAFISVPSVAYDANNPYWAMGLGSDGSAGWSLETWDGANMANRIRVLPGGNVGIGTIGPGYRLDVQGGAINASGGLCIAGDCKTSWSQVGGSGGSGSQWTTSGTSIYYNSGNVGIGTTVPESPLHVAGGSFFAFPKPGQASWTSAVFSNNFDATIRILHSGAVSTLYTDSATQAVNFSTNGSGNSRLFISGGGYVGVGTTSPANRLTVVGEGAGIAQIGTTGCGSNYVGITLPLTVAPGGCTNYTLASSPSDQNLYINRPTGNSIRFRENNGYTPDQLVIASGGNVGIGTATPTAKLDVNGDTKVTGNITVTGNISAKYQDVAEWVPATRVLAAGTVVVLNPTQSNQVMASAQSYDTRVAGVISERPGLTLGEAGKDKVLVATTGRVKVKVDATRAPIHVGDLLVTSDIEGVAMKSMPLDLGGTPIHRPGTLIGKALEPLEIGTGEILVLLSLQ